MSIQRIIRQRRQVDERVYAGQIVQRRIARVLPDVRKVSNISAPLNMSSTLLEIAVITDDRRADIAECPDTRASVTPDLASFGNLFARPHEAPESGRIAAVILQEHRSARKQLVCSGAQHSRRTICG